VRILFAVLVFAQVAAASVDNVRVVGLTSTQAGVSYNAPSSSACTLEVSESPAFLPLVHDVDTALFPSANSDDRSGNVNNGRYRTFVVGQRTVTTAIDGKRYSRALQANTVHYFRVTCGADSASGTFHTANIPLGNSYADGLLADPERPGEYLWPTPHWNDRTGTHVDPQTGALIRTVSLPRDYADSDSLNNTFTSASGPAWTNPSNALANDTNAATYNGSTSDWLLLRKSNLTPYLGHAIDYIQVQIKGSGAGSTEADRTIESCLTLDGGSTCDGDKLEVVLGTTESAKTLGGSTPVYTWRPLSRVNIQTSEISNNSSFGVLIRKKSSSTDQISIQYAALSVYLSTQYGMPSGGNHAMSTEYANANGFYHVSAVGSGGTINGVYAVHGETGEARWLGILQFNLDGRKLCYHENVLWDATDPNVVYCNPANSNNFYKGTLTGNDVEAARSANVTATWKQIGSSTLSNLAQTFYNAHAAEYEVTYDSTKYTCKAYGVQNGYALLVCRRSTQDSYGWVGVLNLSTESVIALLPEFNSAAARWCGIHTYENPGHVNVWFDTTQTLSGASTGRGTYQAKLASAIASTTQTSITVESASLWNTSWGTAPSDGEPVSQYDEHYLQSVKTGDVFRIGSEFVRVTAKSSSNSWTISRGEGGTTASTYPAGTALTAWCANTNPGDKQIGYSHVVWKFLDDPYGHDASGTSLWANQYMGHITARDNRLIAVTSLAVDESGQHILLTKNPTFAYGVTDSARFAGKRAPHEPNTYQAHPSMHQTHASSEERNWALDVRPFIGGTAISADTSTCDPTLANYPASGGCAAARVSGTSNVYKYTLAGSTHIDGLNRKEFATFGVCGNKIARDISGPSSSITDADEYAFCVAHRGGECISGSSAGNIYMNCPGLVKFYCPYVESYSGSVDACISDVPMTSVGTYQLGLVPNNEGRASSGVGADDWGVGYSRLLSTYMDGYRTMSAYANAKALPNGKWILTAASRPDRYDLVLIKTPPFGPKDSLARDRFVPVPVRLNPPSGVDNVLIEFGYDTEFRCTTRNEACVKDANTSEPYMFAGDTLAGIPCASGCTVEIPAIAGKVLYYRWKYRQADDEVISQGATQMTAIP